MYVRARFTDSPYNGTHVGSFPQSAEHCLIFSVVQITALRIRDFFNIPDRIMADILLSRYAVNKSFVYVISIWKNSDTTITFHNSVIMAYDAYFIDFSIYCLRNTYQRSKAHVASLHVLDKSLSKLT